MMKPLVIGLMALGLGAAASPARAAGTYNGLEIPLYSVEAQTGAIELRRYKPFLAAEVTVPGNQNEAARRAFRMLAGFIFGANAPATDIAMTAPVTQAPAKVRTEKIAMTAPVTQEERNEGWIVRFMMPRKYDAETLPRPTNPDVRIVTVDPGLRLSLTFSGLTPPGVVQERSRQLRAHAEANNLQITGPVELARYNDPFTAPWKRRNEVSVQVAR